MIARREREFGVRRCGEAGAAGGDREVVDQWAFHLVGTKTIQKNKNSSVVLFLRFQFVNLGGEGVASFFFITFAPFRCQTVRWFTWSVPAAATPLWLWGWRVVHSHGNYRLAESGEENERRNS
jgi:hypothetical protein